MMGTGFDDPIRRVADHFNMMLIAYAPSFDVDRLDGNMVVSSFSACGASDTLRVNDIRVFLKAVSGRRCGQGENSRLREKIRRLEEEIEKKPLSQWCDRSENERLREEKAALLPAIQALLTYAQESCDEGPIGQGWQSVGFQGAMRDASAAITRVTGAPPSDPLPAVHGKEPT